jgi:hypothetical protein
MRALAEACPRYEETIGMDLALTEIAPKHYVAADPCCLIGDDWEKVRPGREAMFQGADI